ncbi:MAG: glycosyltransferase family 2 protein [Candidatus Diapherotrites archaeon]|nr:glycosyltransferase family 2 protein [Candidatus Micrarchaeota archaeon]
MPMKQTVTVVIPTLNEEDNLPLVVKRISRNYVDEILVVDGGSKDATIKVAKRLRLRVIMQEGRGLGNAYRTGAKKAKGDIMIILDADGSHKPEDIPRLLRKMRQGYDLVVGSRLKRGVRSSDMTFFRLYANYFVAFIMRVLFRVPLTDPWMGFRAIDRKKFLALNTSAPGQEADLEMEIKAKKKGMRIAEIETFEPRRLHGDSKFNVFFDGMRGSVLFARELLLPLESHEKESWLLELIHEMQKRF